MKKVSKVKNSWQKNTRNVQIYATYQNTSLKHLLKKTFELTKEDPDIEENLWVLLIKGINFVPLLVQWGGELYYYY